MRKIAVRTFYLLVLAATAGSIFVDSEAQAGHETRLKQLLFHNVKSAPPFSDVYRFERPLRKFQEEKAQRESKTTANSENTKLEAVPNREFSWIELSVSDFMNLKDVPPLEDIPNKQLKQDEPSLAYEYAKLQEQWIAELVENGSGAASRVKNRFLKTENKSEASAAVIDEARLSFLDYLEKKEQKKIAARESGDYSLADYAAWKAFLYNLTAVETFNLPLEPSTIKGAHNFYFERPIWQRNYTNLARGRAVSNKKQDLAELDKQIESLQSSLSTLVVEERTLVLAGSAVREKIIGIFDKQELSGVIEAFNENNAQLKKSLRQEYYSLMPTTNESTRRIIEVGRLMNSLQPLSEQSKLDFVHGQLPNESEFLAFAGSYFIGRLDDQKIARLKTLLVELEDIESKLSGIYELRESDEIRGRKKQLEVKRDQRAGREQEYIDVLHDLTKKVNDRVELFNQIQKADEVASDPFEKNHYIDGGSLPQAHLKSIREMLRLFTNNTIPGRDYPTPNW